MKFKLFLLVLAFISIRSVAQTDNDIIIKIRSIYNEVNSSTKECSINKFSFDGMSSESGEIVVFSENENILKAIIEYYGEMGKRVVEMYFNRGELVFMFDVVSNYDKPTYAGDVSVLSKEEHRYYIWGNELIKYISPHNIVSWNKSIPQYNQKQDYIASNKNLVNKYNNKSLIVISKYNAITFDELLEKEINVKIRINNLVDNNKELIVPLMATLAEIIKQEDQIYSALGEISWGNATNLTYLVFDLSTDKIYLYNKTEDEVKIIGEDKNYPSILKKWIIDYK